MKLDPNKVLVNVITLLIIAFIGFAFLFAITDGHPHKWALALQIPLIGLIALSFKWTEGDPEEETLPPAPSPVEAPKSPDDDNLAMIIICFVTFAVLAIAVLMDWKQLEPIYDGNPNSPGTGLIAAFGHFWDHHPILGILALWWVWVLLYSVVKMPVIVGRRFGASWQVALIALYVVLGFGVFQIKW